MVFSIIPKIPVMGTTPISPLPKQAAFRQLERYFYTCSNCPGRQAGGVVDLTSVPSSTPIVYVGDLHARVDNLNRVLNTGNNHELLRRGQLVLNLLGDAVHPETGKMDMDSSVVIMQQIMDLKITNPDNFYYYAGNHDSFSMKAMRNIGGIPVFPGIIMSYHLEGLYGSEYVERFRSILARLPIVSVAKGAIATHGGPIKPPFSMERLINSSPANEDDPLIMQAIWGRFECIEEPKLSYDMEDVDGFLSAMGQQDATLLVAHTKPRHGVWHREIAPNHHVIFGAFDRFGYAMLKDGRLSFLDASGSAPFTTGRLPIEFYTGTSLRQAPKRSADEIIKANADLFRRGGLYERDTVGETIIPLESSDVETYGYVQNDGTITAFGNEHSLSQDQGEMFAQGLLYKIEIAELFNNRKLDRSTFDCTLPAGMPEAVKDILRRSIERANRSGIAEYNCRIIRDHMAKISKTGTPSEIPVVMKNDGRIASITAAQEFDEAILEGMEKGNLSFANIVLSKRLFRSRYVFSIPMRYASLLDCEVSAVINMTLEELNKE